MRALLYFVVLFVATGCSFSSARHDHGLDEAEVLLHSDPALAFEQLNGYDLAEFQDSATLARWALLYSEAMAANRLTAPGDTIVNIAIDYYDRHNKIVESRKARAVRDVLVAGGEADALVSALYVQKEKEFLLYKERAWKRQLIFMGVIGLLMATGVILWQCQRLKLRSVQNEALMAEASALKEGLAVRQDECSKLTSRFSDLLSNRFGMIDELCETYYESQGTKAEKKAIVEKVKSQIEQLKSDEGIFTEMEQCHGEMLARLREEMPGLKPDEYRLMVYLASGLSNRTIALLIGESIDVAYKRKSRLKAKIAGSEMTHKEQFMRVF